MSVLSTRNGGRNGPEHRRREAGGDGVGIGDAAAVAPPGANPRDRRRDARGTAVPAAPDRATTAVGYLRRSTDRQEQSIPDQRKTVERYCAEKGLEILTWYTDDAISGTSTLGRRAFQQMMADAQEPRCPFGLIVVYDVKRFGRVDNDEAGYHRHLLKQAGVEVLYATEGFNGNETDDLLRPVKQWQARQESKDLSKVTIRGLLSKSEGGWWMGGVAPHGYDLRYQNERGEFLFMLRHMPDGTKQVLDERGNLIRTLARGESLSISKRDRAKLVLGEESRVRAVKSIFRMYIEDGKGLKAIADSLNRRGIPTPRGPGWSHIYANDGGWRDSTVRAILVNPVYAGDMVWNRRTDAKFHMIAAGRAVERKQAHGARLVPNDQRDWIVAPGTHEGLVSQREFQQAQSIRLKRPASANQSGKAKMPVGGWNGARSRFVLSGLVRCALCQGRYQGVTRQKGTPRRDGTKVRTYSYGCGSHIAKGNTACRFNPIGQEVLESAVIAAVLEFYRRYEGPEGHAALVNAVRAALGVEAADLVLARGRLESERKSVEATIANLLDNITPATRDLVGERLEQLRARRADLELRRAEIERLADEQTQVQDTVQEISSFIDNLAFVLKHGVGEEKMTALRRCVEKMLVDKAAGTAALHIRPLPAPSISGTAAEVVGVRIDNRSSSSDPA